MWMIALTGLVLFVIVRDDWAQKELRMGERFTLKDAQVLCEACPTDCSLNREKIQTIYGGRTTPFRTFLENKQESYPKGRLKHNGKNQSTAKSGY